MRLGLAAVGIAVSTTLAGHFGLQVLALIGITLGTSSCTTWRLYHLRPELTAGQSLPHREGRADVAGDADHVGEGDLALTTESLT